MIGKEQQFNERSGLQIMVLEVEKFVNVFRRILYRTSQYILREEQRISETFLCSVKLWMLFIQDRGFSSTITAIRIIIMVIILVLLTNTLLKWTECVGLSTAQTVDVGRSLINIIFIVSLPK